MPGKSWIRRCEAAIRFDFGQGCVDIDVHWPANLKDGDPFLVSTAIICCGLTKSRSEAMRLIKQGGIYKNNARVTPPDELIFASDLFYDRYMLLRKGRKDVVVLDFLPPGESNAESDWYYEWSGAHGDHQPAGEPEPGA